MYITLYYMIVYVTQDYKTSHKGQFIQIEIHAA